MTAASSVVSAGLVTAKTVAMLSGSRMIRWASRAAPQRGLFLDVDLPGDAIVHTRGSLADTHAGCALLGVGLSGCGNAHVAAMAADEKRVAVVASVDIRAADQRQHPREPGVR